MTRTSRTSRSSFRPPTHATAAPPSREPPSGEPLSGEHTWTRSANVTRSACRVGGVGVQVPPDPARYTRVLCAGFSGERAAEAAGSPRVPVAGGALSDVLSTSGGNVAISDYLGGMFDAGAAKCMDALSFHDYPGGSNLGAHYASVLSAVRATRDAYAPAMTLWITETGLSLSQTGITEATRTSTLPAIYRSVAAMPDVDVLIYHTLVDTSGTSLNGFGLATITTDAAGVPQFNPTTTYSAIQSLLASGR